MLRLRWSAKYQCDEAVMRLSVGTSCRLSVHSDKCLDGISDSWRNTHDDWSSETMICVIVCGHLSNFDNMLVMAGSVEC